MAVSQTGGIGAQKKKALTELSSDLQKLMTSFLQTPTCPPRDTSGVSRPSKAVRAHHRVLWRVGCGTYGDVWLLRDRNSGKIVACKVVPASRLEDGVSIEFLKREVRVMQHLQAQLSAESAGEEEIANHWGSGASPMEGMAFPREQQAKNENGRSQRRGGIVWLEGVHESNVATEIVMEFCAGGDLFDYISDRGAIAESEAKSLFAQLASTLAFCHRHGVIHRDIKPENILLKSKASQNMRARITDFGMATMVEPGTLLSDPVGTKFWAAPEVMHGRSYGTEADVWSLGVVLLCMLIGKLPRGYPVDKREARFWKSLTEDERPRLDLIPWVSQSEEAKDLVRQMLEKDPERRIKSWELQKHPWLSEVNSVLKP